MICQALRCSVLLCSAAAVGAQPTPLPRAHAHNDYLHDRPLLDALDRGFCSVEADVHLVDGNLLVAHNLDETDSLRTLEGLYLKPLLKRADANGGRIYDGGPGLTLLIDFKSDAEDTYQVLRTILSRYKAILTKFEADRIKPGAVTIVISGNRPVEMLQAESVRYAALDGRPGDLDLDPPTNLYPLVSENWTKLFEWRGEPGLFSDSERAALRSLVERAHAQGRRIRLWATPEEPALWKELHAAGVDHINTDQLDALAEFLLHHE